jgi:hypothetical protein
MSVTHLGKIEHINVYYDPEQEKDRLLFGRKSKPAMEQGIIWLPHTSEELWEMAMQYQLDHKDDVVEEVKRTKEDYDFVVGNSMDLDTYKKALKLME